MMDYRTIPQVRLWDAMNKCPPDYDEMLSAINDGADINAKTGDGEGETLLSDIYDGYLEGKLFSRNELPDNWKQIMASKHIDGSHLLDITKFFFRHGFDVKRENGAYGAKALYNLINSTYDYYNLLTAKMLMDEGANINFDFQGETVMASIYAWLNLFYEASSQYLGEWAEWNRFKAAYLERYARLSEVYAYKIFETYVRTSEFTFEVQVIGFGWEHYIFNWGKETVTLDSSTIFNNYDLNDLVEALCFMSPSYSKLIMPESECADSEKCNYPIRITKVKGKPAEWEDIERSSYYSENDHNKEVIEYCVDVPLSVEVEFFAESHSNRIYFYRQESADNEFDVLVSICIDYDSSDCRYYEFLTSYRQLCKEVADGCTRALKEHGLFGCRAASFNHTINICNLIFLKAVGNNKEEWLSIWDSEHKDVPASDYSKELKLLEM